MKAAEENDDKVNTKDIKSRQVSPVQLMKVEMKYPCPDVLPVAQYKKATGDGR